jgi:hypothetical protein
MAVAFDSIALFQLGDLEGGSDWRFSIRADESNKKKI